MNVCQTKISQNDISIVCYQDVAWFDVSMDDILGVTIFDGLLLIHLVLKPETAASKSLMFGLVRAMQQNFRSSTGNAWGRTQSQMKVSPNIRMQRQGRNFWPNSAERNIIVSNSSCREDWQRRSKLVELDQMTGTNCLGTKNSATVNMKTACGLCHKLLGASLIEETRTEIRND